MEQSMSQREKAALDRVLGASCSLGSVTKEQLTEFIQDELNDAALYRCLARLCPKKRRLMCELAAEELCHARRLRARYYIQYKAWPQLTGKAEVCGCPFQTLAGRYQAELEGAKSYAAAAAGECGDMQRLLEDLAKDELRHARAVMCALEA